MHFNHTTVLLQEAVDGLNIKPDGIYVDATLGGGGHSKLISSKLTTGRLICFDQDMTSISYNQEQFKKDKHVTIIKSNFVDIDRHLDALNIDKIDGIIFDLGMSSMQIDEKERGFSYMQDARLDMRMDLDQSLDAWMIVNNYPQQDIEKILRDFGEEKFYKQIARAIVSAREEKPINTTLELVDVIELAIPKKVLYKKHSHPAKKTFQALRIAVNQELSVFKNCLDRIFPYLNVGGRISVITFHSLEDRICKRFFNEKSEVDQSLKDLPVIPEAFLPKAQLVNKKPILPSIEEMQANSRSKSAKLRILEKIREEYENQ